MVTQIYKIRLEIWGQIHQNLVAQKHQILRDFAQLRDFMVNISRIQQDIVNRKTALQTMDTHARANLIWCTLFYKRLKIGPEF